MANEQAKKDENGVSTLLGVLNSDGSTTIRVKANSSNHALKVSDASTGSDNGPTNAKRDDNNVPTLLAVSSVDGVTPVVVYADSNGNLLIDSN